MIFSLSPSLNLIVAYPTLLLVLLELPIHEELDDLREEPLKSQGDPYEGGGDVFLYPQLTLLWI
jgi:hypothetical protein